MKSIGKIASTIGTAALIALWLFFGAKGCVITVWSSPKTAETYVIDGADSRGMMMVFMPNREAMLWYTDPGEGSIEGVLTEMRGTYGTHYFGPLWHIEGPNISFGYRWYSGDVEPVHMELRTKEKYFEGKGESSFPKRGKTTYAVILFGENRIKFQGMWLDKTDNDQATIDALYAKLKP